VSPTDILFHRQVKKSKVETSKDTLISLKRGSRSPPGRKAGALRVGWEKIILTLRAPVFFPAEP